MKAGGFTPDASLHEAYIIRRAREDIQDLELEWLRQVPVEEMTDMEREYFKIKSKEEVGLLSVDFEQLFNSNDKTEDMILFDRDYIYVPKQARTVTVSGQVKRPGLIHFKQDENVTYYVQEAGGFSFNARKSKIRIIKAKTREWLKPSESTKIEVGDTIFVPEKVERNYWEIFRKIMTAAAQLATVILVIQNALKMNE